MKVGDGKQVRRLIESVELDARFADTVCEVNLVVEGAVSGFPLMVQFLIGHPTDTYVIVHEDGVAFSARIRDDETAAPVRCHDRTTGADPIDPEIATISPALLGDVLQALCRTGRAPDYVDWVEVPMD